MNHTGRPQVNLATLLREVPLDSLEVTDLIRHHRVLVLSDLMLPPTAPPRPGRRVQRQPVDDLGNMRLPPPRFLNRSRRQPLQPPVSA
jgi:hypothetical protein